MSQIAGIILMGGSGTRLGGCAKAEIKLGAMSLRAHTQRAMGAQISDCVLSVAAQDQVPSDWDGSFVLDTDIMDADMAEPPARQGRGGPALAILAALRWAKMHGFDAIITSPVDTPFLPDNYGDQLISSHKSQPDKPVFCCQKTDQGTEIHGLHALWPASCLGAAQALIVDRGVMKISQLHKELGSATLELRAPHAHIFHNINTPAELRDAQSLMTGN